MLPHRFSSAPFDITNRQEGACLQKGNNHCIFTTFDCFVKVDTNESIMLRMKTLT